MYNKREKKFTILQIFFTIFIFIFIVIIGEMQIEKSQNEYINSQKITHEARLHEILADANFLMKQLYTLNLLGKDRFIEFSSQIMTLMPKAKAFFLLDNDANLAKEYPQNFNHDKIFKIISPQDKINDKIWTFGRILQDFYLIAPIYQKTKTVYILILYDSNKLYNLFKPQSYIGVVFPKELKQEDLSVLGFKTDIIKKDFSLYKVLLYVFALICSFLIYFWFYLSKRIFNQDIYDLLTSLPNLRLFYELINSYLVHAKREKLSFSVVYFEIKDLLKIKDKVGQNVYSEIIKEISKRIRQNIRDFDILARVDESEFVLLLKNISEDEEIYKVIDKLREKTKEEINIKNISYRFDLIYAATYYPKDSTSSITLVSQASRKMNEKKFD